MAMLDDGFTNFCSGATKRSRPMKKLNPSKAIFL
jgi:hypothetical protein